jgi:hypothetical protein
MFDVDFNDLQIGVKKKSTEWAVVCPIGQDRSVMKLQRCVSEIGIVACTFRLSSDQNVRIPL